MSYLQRQYNQVCIIVNFMIKLRCLRNLLIKSSLIFVWILVMFYLILARDHLETSKMFISRNA